jgi:hypothetical protein
LSSIGARLSACIAAAFLLAGVTAADASALLPYTTSEVVLTNTGIFAPTGLAVDQETGDLYAAGNIGSQKIHRFDAVTELETLYGEGSYESVAINPVNHNIYGLTKPPKPIRIEVYEQEGEIASKPISTPAGKGMIAADSTGNVFIPDIGAISEQQKYTVAATGGTYKLLFEGEETTDLPYNAAEFEVAEALEALAKIGSGNVSVSRSGQTYTVSYGGALEKIDLPLLTADNTNLTEGAVTKLETVVDGTNAPPTLKEYAPNGTPRQTITCAACPSGAFTATPAGIAIDGEDNLYVADPAKSRVVIFHATPGNPTDYTTTAPTELSPGAVRSVAVDPATKQVFVGGDDGGGFHVKGYEPNGTLFADFGLGMFPGTFAGFFGTEQLTVDGNTGTVYVGDLVTFGENLATALVGFIPAPAPTIVAKPATVIEVSTHATMNGTVNPNGTLVLSCKFEYGPDTNYGTTVPCNDPGFGNEPVPVSAEATGLTPDTSYHYRIVATNESGTTVGADQEFKTLIEKASATTGAASSVLQTTLTLEGSINPGGHPLTACRFEYGSDETYGNQVPCANLPGSGNSPVTVTGAVSGLKPNSTYHFRVVAVNAGGIQNGADNTVATPPKAPAISTGAATQVGPDRARIAGTVNPEGSVSRYQFEYGTSAAYGSNTTSATAVGSETIKVAANLIGVEPATTYHYRLSATSVGGTTHGADQTFTTGPRPIGRVFLPAKARLKKGKAAMEVQCRGVAIAECKGTLVLRGRIKQGIRFILVKVGTADFDYFGGTKQVITVALNKAGKKVIEQSEGKPIPLVASAANKNRVVRLSHGAR